MKKTLLKIAGAALLAFALTTASKADPITGTIQFSGLVTFNTGSPATATSASFANITVAISGGDLSSTFLQPVTIVSPWTFANTNFDLWTVAGFTFHVDSSTILAGGTGIDNVTNQPWIQVATNGSISSTNPLYDVTEAVFTFSSEGPGTVNGQSLYFTFSAHTEAVGQGVPDGGTTALLVGLGLVGMSFVARRRK
ncbi:MAG: hypothetical protein JWM32_546 [Verrucomicrobia bacterium]|nr:hypothetical protein [Verrucomicrobiota bacterium]